MQSGSGASPESQDKDILKSLNPQNLKSSGSPGQDSPTWSGLSSPTLECNRGDKDILKSQKLQILKFSKSSQQFDLKLVGCAPNRLKLTVYVYVILHGIYHQCMIHHTFEVFVMIIVMAFIILPIFC